MPTARLTYGRAPGSFIQSIEGSRRAEVSHDRLGPAAVGRRTSSAQSGGTACDHPRHRQSFIEGRIAELEEIVSAAEVIDPSSLSGESIKFGAHVWLVDEETEKE